MRSICVDSFMFENGERYCHIVNKNTGEPLYYPNLYITTQVRNRSESIDWPPESPDNQYHLNK